MTGEPDVIVVSTFGDDGRRVGPDHLPPGSRSATAVLFLILGGLIIGPHVLGFADSADIELLAELGLGFLFLLAGHELDPQLLREKAGHQALVAWTISAIAAVAIVGP